MSSTAKKPRYINPAGSCGVEDLPSKPPFLFQNVTARVFPIKANMARLSSFCDSYLNADPETFEFRPSIPYVYLMVINYGSMSAAAVQAQNIGWVAQREVAFTVPLERWRRDGERRIFEGWSCVSPFIFVDDELSLTTGREVYGWPKVISRVDADVPLWAKDPRAPTRVFSLKVPLFGTLYAGQRESWHELIEIDRDAVPRFTEFPPDPHNPWNPLTFVPAALRSWIGLAGDAGELLLRQPLRGFHDRRTLRSLREMYRVGLRSVRSVLPDSWWLDPDRLTELLGAAGDREPRERRVPSVDAPRGPQLDVITLKQFRDTHRNDQACYKALIRSAIGIDRLNRCGLLGDYNMLRGDPSGGYSIRLHQYPAQPIVETLGLNVVRVEDGAGVPLAILQPSFPFWTDVDLFYGVGEVLGSEAQCHLAERSQHRPWRRGGAEIPAEAPRDGHEARSIPYNTVQGAATQAVTGPFHFPDTTIQVYPLLAEQAKLQAFLDAYLNAPLDPAHAASTGMRFEALGRYVYLMVTVYGDQVGVMWSESNNIGWWADKEVAFGVPVKCYRKIDGDEGGDRWELASLGLVSPFVFGNSGRAVITDREINGRPTVKAEIDSPADSWLAPSGPVAERRFLRLSTEVFPALNLGQKSEHRTLLEIDGDDVLRRDYDDLAPLAYSEDDPDWRRLMDAWGMELIDELKRKQSSADCRAEAYADADALALEVLALGAPINSFHVKQYRDAAELDRACYQAVVKTSRCLTRLYDFREIRQRLHVRLHRFPGFPIAEMLGLRIKHIESKGGDVVQVVEPIRPFWLRGSVREHLGEVLCWRSEQQQWMLSHPWLDRELAGKLNGKGVPFFAGRGATRVGPGVFDVVSGPFDSARRGALDWLERILGDEFREICPALISRARTGAIEPILSSLRRVVHRVAQRASNGHQGIDSAESGDLARVLSLLGDSPTVDEVRRLIDLLEVVVAASSQTSGDPCVCIGEHFRGVPVRERYVLIEAARALLALAPELADPGPGVRLTRDASRRAVDGVEELQIVIERLLHRDWKARRALSAASAERPPEEPPAHHIPDASLPNEWIAARGISAAGVDDHVRCSDPYGSGLEALGLGEFDVKDECGIDNVYCVAARVDAVPKR